MLEIIDPQLILAVLIAITAAALTSYVGFGGALIMVPLFTILFGPVDAIAITTLCSVLSLSPVVFKVARDVEWSQALPLSIGIIISNTVGVIFLTSADPSFVVFGIGLFVLVSGCILMSGFSYQGPRNRTTSVIFGCDLWQCDGWFWSAVWTHSCRLFLGSAYHRYCTKSEYTISYLGYVLGDSIVARYFR